MAAKSLLAKSLLLGLGAVDGFQRAIKRVRINFATSTRLFRGLGFGDFADDFAGAGFVWFGDGDARAAVGFEVHGDLILFQRGGEKLAFLVVDVDQTCTLGCNSVCTTSGGSGLSGTES